MESPRSGLTVLKTNQNHSQSNPTTAATNRGSYWITTFGCQMNKADSERMAGILEKMGYQEAQAELKADLVLYNTCTIRDNAEQKVYSYLGRQAQRKQLSPHLKLIVAGCVAQQEGEALLRRVPEIDLVMGPQHANRLETLLNQVDNGQQVLATEELHIIEDLTTARRDSKTCAWVNVIYGCNERCTYCVVPSVRGKEQSRTPEAIRLEIENLSKNGFKEITLLGQNIDAYGRDLKAITSQASKQFNFRDLLYYIHDTKGIERIRFATSHPRYFTNELIDACAELPKVCEHFHIPFQSGDNEILRMMSRGYTIEKYKQIIDRIKQLIPDSSISADVIVAFPGETDKQFKNTLSIIEDIEFDQVNTAAYSPRPNTPAAKWSNQISEAIKVERLKELNKLVERVAKKKNARYKDKIEEVLIEGINPKNENQFMGRTRTNRLTFFSTDTIGNKNYKPGDLINIKIKEIRAFSLTGEAYE